MKRIRVTSRLTKAIWVANFGILVGLGILAGSFWMDSAKARGAGGLKLASTSTPVVHWIASPYYLPSVTPNPKGLVLEALYTQTAGPYGPFAIGTSFSGRPIEVYRFGNGPSELLIVAGIHGGNEWNTIALADELIAYLSAHPETVPADKTLYILRNLNPDGEARAHDRTGRVNDRGVDLNRNWPYRWAAEWDRDGCWDYLTTTGGEYPASETEVQVLINFVETHSIDALISYHSAALGIFAGGVPTLPASDRLARAFEKVSGYAYPPLNTGCNYTGNLTDWASSVKNIPAVDIELRNHQDTDFDDNLRILEVFLTWKR